tara:strand:+ start:28 stop:384 length:357 start_codon:yes stop_codon:yes gene_type:complete
MLNKTQQKQLEAKVGSLDLVPAHLKQALIEAFLKALQIEKEKQRIEQKYSTYAGTPDTPDRKLERYRMHKAMHYGLLPGVVCSCFRDDTAATPCAYVPDKTVGPLESYYKKHSIWWKV